MGRRISVQISVSAKCKSVRYAAYEGEFVISSRHIMVTSDGYQYKGGYRCPSGYRNLTLKNRQVKYSRKEKDSYDEK